MDMKIHMFYNKIKVEIDINNDELLENCIKTHEIKKVEGGGILLN
jgi:hypothetical protein